MSKRLATEMTGLDTLISVGYRRGDKWAFQARSAVSSATVNHQGKEASRWYSSNTSKRAIERIHADGAEHITALVY
jgi:predicted ATP-grasp superfamily ATP-dependent carboligase